ncbi:MAG TPA: DUF1592 domain-containing protein [Deltaproteobacteria bacterium]|nr:DUF1592 domain-containing protein [Deltaproteobacteria bacterium]
MWLAIVGCGTQEIPPGELHGALLSPTERLIRISITLRGRLPSATELEAVREDPSSLSAQVDAYLASEDFGAVIRDMHAELLLTRTDIGDPLPLYGPLDQMTTDEVYAGISEEPLRLVEHVVVHDRPYTEVLTADYMLANPALAVIYGLEHDPAGPEWQVSHYEDGRPHAGLLTSSELLRRHESAGSNFHRGRANFFSSALLCEAFDTREILVDGGIDLTDEEAVAHAVQQDPNCIGCHQPMDPLAATFFGFKQLLRGQTIRRSYAAGCRWDPRVEASPELEQYSLGDNCYPLRLYNAGNELDWVELGLRAPAYFGRPVEDLPGLARAMADDPRFAQCTARRFYSYFAQIGRDDVPLELASELQEIFVSSGFDAKELTRAIVTSDAFLAREPLAQGDAPILLVRPESYARIIEDLTGFSWIALPEGCTDEECWSQVDLGISDRYGFRSMAGGIDGLEIVRPTHTNAPVRFLVHQRFAQEAAGFVVASDLQLPRAQRHLLDRIEGPETDEATVRSQLVSLHKAVLSMSLEPDHLEIDETWEVWSVVAAASGPEEAWKLIISLLLQDPRLTHY